jgi:hypothetical protein
MPISPRRLVSWAAVVCVIILAVVACWHDTAYAHGNVVLTLHSDGRGSVWADVAWEDGHPVAEPIAAAISGQSAAGGSLGPAAMRGTPGEATVRYEGTLAPGRWTVTVDAATPGPGTCTATFDVGPEAVEGSTTCAPPTPLPGAAASGGDDVGEVTGGVPWGVVAITAGVLLAAGVVLALTTRRMRPTV